MKNEILETIIQYKFEHISSEQAVSELLVIFGIMQGLPELKTKLAQKANYVKGWTVDPKFKGLAVPVIEFNEAIEIIEAHFGSPTVGREREETQE